MRQHTIKLRDLKSTDIENCIKLFQETIHTVNAKDYNQEQLNIWAPQSMNSHDKRWQNLLENISFVAEMHNQIVGFADMTHQGYLDRLYVHKDYQRLGIASALAKTLEQHAKNLGLAEMTTEASITAKPFFEATGYLVIKQQEKDVSGVKMVNIVMKKALL